MKTLSKTLSKNSEAIDNRLVYAYKEYYLRRIEHNNDDK